MRNFQRDNILTITKKTFSFIMFASLFGCDIDVKNDVDESRDEGVEDNAPIEQHSKGEIQGHAPHPSVGAPG